MENREIKKILVIKYSGIGDVVNVTPALRLLKAIYPNADIDFIASEWTEPATRYNPNIRKTYVIKNEWVRKMTLPGAANLAAILLKLRMEKYDAALVFQQSHLFRKLVKWAGITNAVYFCDSNPQANEVAFDEEIHIIDNNLNLTVKLLSGLGVEKSRIDTAISQTGKHTDWIIREEEKKEADGIFRQHNITPGTKIIGLVAGGAFNPVRDESEIRQWGVDNYRELIEKFKEKGNIRILLAGGPNDKAVSEELEKGNTGFVINLAGKIPLRVSAALLARCSLVISNDTGPMHIAGAVGVPLIGIFGPTPSKFALPPGDNCIALQSNLPCSPCYYRVFKGCLFEDIKCMKTITPQQVFEAANKMLK